MPARNGAAVDADHLRRRIRSAYEVGKVVGEGGKEFPIHPHGVSQADGEALRDLAVRAGAVHTVETGMCFGLSTMFLCEAVAASGRSDARHVAVDPRQASWDFAGVRAVREARVDGLVDYHDEGPEVVLPRFLGTRRVFDFALIDGDHRFEGAFLDLYFMSKLVKPGGLIVVQQVWMPAVRLAVSYFLRNAGLKIEHVTSFEPRFTGAPAFLRAQLEARPKARVAVLRRPVGKPPPGSDDLVAFADWETGRAPMAGAIRAAGDRLRSALAGSGWRGTAPRIP